MKKEFIKKLSVFGLIGAMLIPTLAFANNTTDTITAVPADKPSTERPFKGERPENDNGRIPMAGERGAQFGDRSLELVTLYTPELLDSFEAATDLQSSIRDSINALQKSKIEARQADYKAFLNALKTRLEAGTLTRVEAQTQIEAFKTSHQTDSATLKTKLEALRDAYSVDQDANKTLMTTLKTAIEKEDEATIKASLETMLTQLQKHVEYEQALYDLLSAQ